MAAAVAIAYRLSFLSKQAYDIILRTIQDDPSILQAHIRDQWERLVLNTLRKVEDRPSFRPLLVLDGLDECKSQDDQLWIINQLVELCREFPIAVMIASRPEWHLKEEFLRLQRRFPSLFRSTIDLCGHDALSDMRTIFYKRYPYFRRTMEKAPESKRLEIEEGIIHYFSKVGGQYIAIDKILMDDRIESGIYMTLDDTGYTGFMANVYSNLTEEQITMSRRLLFHLLHIQPASIESLSAIWRYSPEGVHIALRPFHSVLHIPLSDRHHITFYLFTFQKYLSSRHRGGEKRQFLILWSHFCIDALEYSLDFAGRCWKYPVIPAGSATLWLMIAPRINIASRDLGGAISRNLANPVPVPDNPIPPTSPILNAIVSAVDYTCQCDPRRVRTLWEIVYNCMSTITLCTFFAIHHNLPDPDASTMGKLWQKIKTTLYALLAPEAIITLAMRQRFVASRIARQYSAQGWTKTHGFFVQMGGLIYNDGKDCHVITIGPEGDVRLGDFIISDPGRAIVLPEITEEEIQDKGKGNFISKAVVVIQTTWFVCNCIARHAQNLSITKLELVTLAFAALNIVTYVLWWNKPLDAQYPIYFTNGGRVSQGPWKRKGTDVWASERYWGVWFGFGSGDRKGGALLGAIEEANLNAQSLVVALWYRLVKLPFVALFLPLSYMIGRDMVQSRVCVGPYYAGRLNGVDKDKMVLLSSLIGIGFGGIHLIGWNFEFPTRAEQTVWRVTSIVITAEPALLGLHMILHHALLLTPNEQRMRILDNITDASFALFGIIGPFIYTIARIVLLAQSLISLRDNSPSIYENVLWSAYLPHV
ncbi:hypothetical protein AX16_003470 [Volvariella volvacea WC 439]|nr:hypothetical protein AX16_003470 [Volvariella volvacea WC 439]